MDEEYVNGFSNSLAFSAVYDVLENKKVETHKSTPYRIDHVLNYLEKVKSSFENLKLGGVIDFPVNALKNVAEHYSVYPLVKESQIDYINNNLENTIYQLNDLRDNPTEFHLRNDSELIGLVGSIKSLIDRDFHDAGELLRRELEYDD